MNKSLNITVSIRPDYVGAEIKQIASNYYTFKYKTFQPKAQRSLERKFLELGFTFTKTADRTYTLGTASCAEPVVALFTLSNWLFGPVNFNTTLIKPDLNYVVPE